MSAQDIDNIRFQDYSLVLYYLKFIAFCAPARRRSASGQKAGNISAPGQS
ncbi:MAG: hypothetical protein LBQ63_00705 [Deltaproteobacteria bacterium]|jgi:hypothetical protein|nr:hypothetical protein [Deltaproteobacteria bacterium]